MGIAYQEGPSLARDLGLPLCTLYAANNRIPVHYHRAEIPKRDGGVRVLRAPDPALKDIQRRIARVLLSGMSVSPHTTAYRYSTGAVGNARRHVGRPELLKLDILHFFDSTRHIQVKEAAFPAEIYAEPQEQCPWCPLGQVDFWLQAQPDSQEAEYRRWLLVEMRDKR